MINDLIDLLMILAGLGVFLGVMGGICFWIVLFDRIHQHHINEKEKEATGCRSCQSYETCMTVMGGELPDRPCAYWQKKKP